MEKLTQNELNELRDKFQEYRFSNNKTLRDMAKELGVSAATLTRFEGRVGLPSQRTVFLIYRYLRNK